MPQVIGVALEKGSMSIYQNPNPGEFAFGDSVPIRVTGFPSNAKVTSISVYQNTTVNGANAKGPLIGTWNASNPSVEPESELSFSVDERGVVSIEDTDEDADETLWYGVTVSDGTSTWSADPELIVKKKD
jgi:hypothetical protein